MAEGADALLRVIFIARDRENCAGSNGNSRHLDLITVNPSRGGRISDRVTFDQVGQVCECDHTDISNIITKTDALRSRIELITLIKAKR